MPLNNSDCSRTSFVKALWFFPGTKRFYGSMFCTFAYWFLVYGAQGYYDFSNATLCLLLLLGSGVWFTFIVFKDRSLYRFVFSSDTIHSILHNRVFVLAFIFATLSVPLGVMNHGVEGTSLNFEMIFIAPVGLLFSEVLLLWRHKSNTSASISRRLQLRKSGEELSKHCEFSNTKRKKDIIQECPVQCSCKNTLQSASSDSDHSSLAQVSLQKPDGSTSPSKQATFDSDIFSSIDTSSLSEATLSVSSIPHKESSSCN